MDIIQLYDDFSLDYKTSGQHKHVRTGYVNVECPFCTGNPGYHLSYHLHNEYFVCWRCGWKSSEYAISGILKISINEAKNIIEQYGGTSEVTYTKKEHNTKPFTLPSEIVPLQKSHKNYLIGRNFDPDKLERVWGITGTRAYSKIEKLSYKNRIIIPFMWDGKIVSFDSRDITGKALNKYQACPLEREIIPHKEILYGKQEKWKDRIIVVEGPTDVWRFGVNSVATSGIKFTNKQIRVIAKRFKTVFVCFDGGEHQALEQANLLVSELKFRGVDCKRIDIIGDPGNMEQSEANYLVKQLIK